MKQLNTYRFYELGAKLHSLFCPTQQRIADMFAPLTEAQTLLDSFIKGDEFAIDTSKAEATKLLNKISQIFNRYFIDPATKQLLTPKGEDRIDSHEIAHILTLIEKFEHALAAELNRAPTYLAAKYGIYSTYDLAENAEKVFAENLRIVIPASAQSEFRDAGRALAFGLGTAASVHMIRAIEIVLKPYFESYAGAVSAKSERNFSMYLKKLVTMAEDEDAEPRPDKRVVQMLSQIKDHYRNPLLSADISISVNEATQFFGVASALISLMAERLMLSTKEGKAEKNGKSTPAPTLGEFDEDDNYDFRLSQAV